MIEIERKFLVNSSEYKDAAQRMTRIVQGYISRDPERSVRVRMKGASAYLTIKGGINETGTSRYEWEKEIAGKEAEDLLKLCLPEIIEKTRYYVEIDDFVIEVDEFSAMNKGLVLAEIELPSEDAVFPRPSWLGEEVTGQKQYYNVWLSKIHR